MNAAPAPRSESKPADTLEMKTKIERWARFYQIGALRILANQQTKLNENKNGIFVNLSCASPEALEKLANYVEYVEDQISQLRAAENTKEQLKDAFFDKQEWSAS